MIVTEIYKQSDGKIIGFSVDGHANTAKHGHDIYCAAASMISSSTLLCLRDYLKRDLSGEAKHGLLKVMLEDAPDDLTEVAFQTLLIGMREVEKQVPKIVKVKELAVS